MWIEPDFAIMEGFSFNFFCIICAGPSRYWLSLSEKVCGQAREISSAPQGHRKVSCCHFPAQAQVQIRFNASHSYQLHNHVWWESELKEAVLCSRAERRETGNQAG